MSGSAEDIEVPTVPPGEEPLALQLTPTLAAEYHGTEFYVVSRGEGHDLTLSIEADVAERLAWFILERLGHRPGASLLPHRRQDEHEDKTNDP